jgi:hypothetical protein
MRAPPDVRAFPTNYSRDLHRRFSFVEVELLFLQLRPNYAEIVDRAALWPLSVVPRDKSQKGAERPPVRGIVWLSRALSCPEYLSCSGRLLMQGGADRNEAPIFLDHKLAHCTLLLGLKLGIRASLLFAPGRRR